MIDIYICPSCQPDETPGPKDLDCSIPISGLDAKLFREAQRHDTQLPPIIQALEEGNADYPAAGPYELKNELLWRRDGCLVVPGELQKVVMMECHMKPIAGHLGKRKTLARLKYSKLC